MTGPPADPPLPPEDAPRPAAARGSRARRWLVGLAAVLAGLLLAVLVLLRQPAFATRVVNAVLARFPPLPRSNAVAERVRGDWLSALEVEGLRVTRGDTLLVSVRSLRARYRLLTLFLGRLDVDALEVRGVNVTADIRDTTGRRPKQKKPPLTPGELLAGKFYSGLPLRVARVSLDDARYGGHHAAPDSGLHLTQVALHGSRVRLGGPLEVHLDSLTVRVSATGDTSRAGRFELAAALAAGRLELEALRFRSDSSDVEARGSLALGERDALASAGFVLRAAPFSLGDLRAFTPRAALAGELFADAQLTGTRTDRLSGRIEARLDRARMASFDMGPVRANATMTDGLMLGQASVAYEGAVAALRGSLRPLDVNPSYAVEARLDRLPARLGALAWWPALRERADATLFVNVQGTGYSNAALEVTGRVEGQAGLLTLAGGLRSGRTLSWEVSRLDFERLDLARLAGDTVASHLHGSLSASGTRDRDGGNQVTAELELEPSRHGDVHVKTGALRARASGRDLSGSLSLESDAGVLEVESIAASLAPGGAFHVSGARFRDVNLARILRRHDLASALHGTVSLRGRGLVRAEPTATDGAASPASDLAGELRLELSPSSLRGRRIERGSARGTLARGSLVATVRLDSDAGRLDGVAHALPFATPARFRLDSLRVEDLDLAAWTGAPALVSDLTGTLTAEGRAAASRTRTAQGSGLLRVEPSTLGRTRLDGGELRATLAGDRAHVEGRIGLANEAIAVRSDARLAAARTTGDAELTVPLGLLAALTGRDSLASRGALTVRATLKPDAASRPVVEGQVSGHGSLGRARLDSLLARLSLGRGTLDVDTLLVRSNFAVARGGGALALDESAGTRRSNVRVRVELEGGAPLGQLLGADTLALASGSLDLAVRGTGLERSIEAKGNVRSLAWNDLRLGAAEVAARGRLDRGWRPVQGSAEASLRQLVGVVLPVHEARAHATLDGSLLSAGAAAALEEGYVVRVAGSSRFDSLGAVVTLDTLGLRADTTAWALARATRIELAPNRTRIENLELRSQQGLIRAHGHVDRLGEQDLRVELRGVGMDLISRVLGREHLDAVLDGDLVLSGPAASPNANGAFALALDAEGRPAGTLSSRLSWNDEQMRIDGRFTAAAGDSLTWAARLPLALSLAPPEAGKPSSAIRLLEGDVDVRVAAARFPLQSLAPLVDPRRLKDLAGTLDMDARLSGDHRSLAGQGRLELSHAAVTMPDLGVTYGDVELESLFRGDRLVVNRAHATSSGGTLDLTGELRFVSVNRVEPKLHLATKRFAFVRSPDLRAIATADVDVTGTLTAPVVRGNVTVGSSFLYFTQPDLAAAEASTQVRLTDADIRMMEETFGYVKLQPAQVPLEIYEASDLDLKLTLERDTWLRQRVAPKLSVALAGEVRLKKPPHSEPELFGRIEPIENRGYVEQFARSFDITGGEVLLNGKMKAHTVSIQAQYKPTSSLETDASDVVVKLDVEGTVDHLKLTLSSEPAMSEAEIVSFIATGRSSAVKTSPTSSSSQEASLLKDIGLSTLTGAAEAEAVGLDVLQVRFDAAQGATLVAGRYVDPQLYVGFRRPLQYKENASPTTVNNDATTVELEYAISRWLVLNLQGETSKVRSFIRARYAY